MKRKVYYIQLCSPLVVGQSAYVVPINHTSDLVSNWHQAQTSTVVSIAQDGTTFETLNSIYVLAAKPNDNVGDVVEKAEKKVPA